MSEIRKFDTGATRDTDIDKYDYEGFLSPLVLERYGQYMNKHRKQADGNLRDSDNWQNGIPKDAYIKSAWRHFMDWWKEHRGLPSREGLEDALCALMFNVMGYLHETLKEKQIKNNDNKSLKLYQCPNCGSGWHLFEPMKCHYCGTIVIERILKSQINKKQEPKRLPCLSCCGEQENHWKSMNMRMCPYCGRQL